MAVNFGYIKSLVGLLKLTSIVLLVIACASGMHAYLSSTYNKDCTDLKPTPNPTTSTSTFPTSSDSVTPSTSLRQNISTSTEGFVIITLFPQPTFSTTRSPKTGCDKAPILWMERLHLIVTGICMMSSIILLLLHLVNGNLLENSKFRGLDFGYHFFGAIWLIVSSVFMAFSATKIESLVEELCSSDPDNCQLMKPKLAAAGFAFLAGIFFIAVGIKNFGKKFYQTV